MFQLFNFDTIWFVDDDRFSVVEVEKNRVLNQEFWRVENSALVKEFKRQGAGIRDDDDITHYVFITYSDCINVLSMLEPEITNTPGVN